MLRAGANGHYGSEIVVNGRTAIALIDTGVSWIAFNRSDAQRLGLSYQNGRRISVGTASGSATAYLITLDSVQMGPILLKNIEATVVDNPTSPQYPLVGMSFLRQLEMDSVGGVLRLKQTR